MLMAFRLGHKIGQHSGVRRMGSHQVSSVRQMHPSVT
jgi:hypothetical protein